MADVAISGLTALGAAPATNDLLCIVDVSDTTQSANGTTKKLTVANLFTAPTLTRLTVTTGTITTSQPLVSGTQTWNDAAVTFTAVLVNVTDTASAAASLLVDFQVAGVSKWKVSKAGAATVNLSLTVGGSDQTDASVRARKGGNGVEFGHPTAAGYASMLGAEAGTGLPFIAFHAEAGTTDNTYRTRGIAGLVVRPDNLGGLAWYKVPLANADNQSLTLLATLSDTGLLSLTGGLQFANAAPSVLANGQVWYDGTNLKCRLGGSTKTITVA